MKLRILNAIAIATIVPSTYANGVVDKVFSFFGMGNKEKPSKPRTNDIIEDDDAELPSSHPSQMGGDVVAELKDGAKIYKKQVEELISKAGAESRSLNRSELFLRMTKHLVAQKIAEKKASSQPLSNEVKRKLADSRRQIIVESYIRERIEKFSRDETKIRDAYKAYSDHINKSNIQEYKLHLLILQKDEVDSTLASIRNMDDFVTVCKQKRMHTDRYFTDMELMFLGDEVHSAVKKMKVGEYTKAPVQVREAYILIALEDRRKHSPRPIEEIRDDLRNAILITEYAKLEEQLFQESNAVLYDENGKRVSEEELKKLSDSIKRDIENTLNPKSVS